MSALRVAIAQIAARKADYGENLRRVGGVLARLAGEGDPPDVVVFPETVMSGYFLEGGVGDVAVTAGTLFRDLAAQHALSGCPPVDVVVGFYEEFRNRHYNAALYATLGGGRPGIRHVHRKVFLPTYGLFDEGRFVTRGHAVQRFDASWGRGAITICEDVWHSLVPTLAALDGAQVVFVPSASPARGLAPDGAASPGHPESVRRWERVIRRAAEENGVYVVLAQLVGFEGGKALAGGSVVASPHGEIVARGPLFEEAVVTVPLALREITRARAAYPLLADLETELLNLLEPVLGGPALRPAGFDPEDADAGPPPPAAPADIPLVAPSSGADPLRIDPDLAARWLVRFLQEEVRERRGFAKGIVGLSGGVDSSLTAALAARALGPENVIGVRMPYRTSGPDSLEHAALVADRLGIETVTVDITAAVDAYVDAADRDADALRRGNVMARMRMITLFDLSAKHGALPLGTGNKTERLLGYFTWHGDDAPPVNPLGDLFKTQVRVLARHLGLPEEILAKPATADLVADQTDEADLGISYEKADRILYELLEGRRREEIVALGFAPEEVDVVAERFHGTHWKRRLPTVAVVSGRSIGESYLRPVDYGVPRSRPSREA